MSNKTKKVNIPYGKITIGLGFLYLLTQSNTANAGAGGTVPLLPGSGGNGFVPVQGSEGTWDESYLGLSGAPRGVRNNNPGNEKRTNSNWNGKIPFAYSSDPVFEQFSSYGDGVRVMIYELKNNYIDAGFNTIDKIIKRYAPPSSNPGYLNYIAYVSQRTGLSANQTLSSDKNTLKKLVQAMTRLENGQTGASSPEIVTDLQFDYAWSIL